ncbi:MAG TPA: DUF4347 domain-containing protein, partial [Accumulibacter sp.]|nr:DUF4347 domain-containing protein [Accumulibacter sp.]
MLAADSGSEVRVLETTAPPSAAPASTVQSQTEKRHEVVIVDGGIADWPELIADLPSTGNDRTLDIALLDPSRDGLQQITEILSQFNDLAAVHLVSHGASGEIVLGNRLIDRQTLEENSDLLQRWGQSLSADGDLLLYGCQVGEGAGGQSFIAEWARLSGADVAASDDITGAADLGGDWELEVTDGGIETVGLAAVPWHGQLAVDSATTTGTTTLPSTPPTDPLPASGSTTSVTSLKPPLAFEQNVGQFDAGIDYVARGGGYSVLLTGGDALINVGYGDGSGHVVRVDMLGSNTARQATAEGLQNGRSNYLIGNDESQWHTDVANYSAVRYADVFNGVDVRYYGTDNQLEYDFIVAAGADAHAIALKLDGAQSVAVVDDGSLRVTLDDAGHSLSFKAPVAYQIDADGQRLAVASRYEIRADGSVGFALGAYDTTRELVIDPVLSWDTVLGGNGFNITTGATTDAAGNVYLICQTSSTNLPAAGGAYTTASTAPDAFVLKLNSSGARVYSTYLAGNGGDAPWGITVDSAGAAYVVGQTTSTDLPVPGAYDNSVNGTDAFLIKLNTTGSAVTYGTYLGGSGTEVAYSVAVDNTGKAWVVGYTTSTLSAGPAIQFPQYLPIDTTVAGTEEGFIARFDTTLTGSASRLFSSVFGGNGSDILMSVTQDASGNAIIAGYSSSTDWTTTAGAYDTTQNGSTDGVVLRVSTGYALTYSSYLGGSGIDYAESVAVDASGYVYLGGFTYSTQATFPITAGAARATLSGTTDSFAAKLDLGVSGSGGLLWSTYGGTGGSTTCITLDASGNVWLLTDTTYAGAPATPNAADTTYNGGYDLALEAISPDGKRIGYLTYLGSSNDELSSGLAYANGSIIVAGHGANAANVLAPTQTVGTPGGTNDSFVADYTLSTPVLDLDADNSSGATGTGFNAAWSAGGGAKAVADADATITDSGSTDLQWLTVQNAGLADGASEVLAANTTGTSIAASYNSATGTLTLSGWDTVAHYQQVLRTITYNNAASVPTGASRVLTFTVSNGVNSAGATTNVQFTNTAPVFSNLNGTPAYTENAAAVVLDADVTIADTQLTAANNFSGATLTLARNGGANAQDVFSATGALSSIAAASGNVVVSGTPIGTYTNSGGTLVFTFNASATNALVNSAMQAIAYANSSDAPPASVAIRWLFNDGNAGAQGLGGPTAVIGTRTVNITTVNDAPTFGNSGIVTTTIGTYTDTAYEAVVQPDGKILAVGESYSSDNELAFVRYNADGTLDTSFGGGDGKLTIAIGPNYYPRGAAMLADGKIVVAGGIYVGSAYQVALVRCNADGTLDTGFGGGDGIVTTSMGAISVSAQGLAIQSDGKIVVVGSALNGTTADVALLCYNADGTLDASFGGGDGIVTTAVDAHNYYGASVAMQADGKILVAGVTADGSSSTFALLRYTASGTLDASFGGGDGITTTSFPAGHSNASALIVQPNGKIIVTGTDGPAFALARYTTDGALDTSFGSGGTVTTVLNPVGCNASAFDATLQADGKIILAGYAADSVTGLQSFAVVRYTANGSLDTGFGRGDGIALVADGAGIDWLYSVTTQSDGKIVAAGFSSNYASSALALLRFNANGTLDKNFGSTSTLGAAVSYTENGSAVVLESGAQIADPELSTADNFNGATLTLTRNGGANAQDVFSASGTLGTLTQSGNLTVGGTTIGTVTTNSAGTLLLTFGAGATNARVNSALQQIAYSNTSDAPPTSVQIDWTFNDGNSGAQGTGGALAATGGTTIAITAVNDAPTIAYGEGEKTFVEGGGAIIIDATATVSDADSANFAGGHLLVDIPTNGWIYDRIAVRNEGMGAGQVGVSGANVYYGGVAIGTWSGSGAPLDVAFNANADLAAAQAVMRNISFDAAEDTFSPARTLRMRLSDGDGGDAVAITKTIRIQNDRDLWVTTESDTADGDTSSITALLANLGADGQISLREALLATNNTPNSGIDADRIYFNLAGLSAHTIKLTSALPTISDKVTIDGTTDDSYNAVSGQLAIALDGNSLATDGLVLADGSDGSTIRGLVIGNFTGDGIEIQAGAEGNTIAGNYIGSLDAAGTATGSGMGGAGIHVQSRNNLIGGTTAADRNVIAGNTGYGIWLADAANTVRGNYVGLAADGLTALGNSSHGIAISASNSVIGGSSAYGNVISANAGHGIAILGGNSNTVAGNIVGLDATGTVKRGNTGDGVSIRAGSHDNLIGGSTPEARNILSGNERGVLIIDASIDNTVAGNYIGVDISGELALGNNLAGIEISGSTNNTIGGPTAAWRNVISGNANYGVKIVSGADGTVVRNNYIGTDDDGLQAVANTDKGIQIMGSAGVVIGGVGRGNLISGNSSEGISLNFGTTGAIVQGNLIGTDATGAAALANGGGILIGNASHDNTIGGTAAGAGNTISGNIGVAIWVDSSNGTLIQGNRFGTTADGSAVLANGSSHIMLYAAGSSVIGGATAEAGNLFAGSPGAAIWLADAGATGNEITGNTIGTDASLTQNWGNAIGVRFTGPAHDNMVRNNVIAHSAYNAILTNPDTGSGNAFLGNRIYGSGEIGIDLDAEGVTLNDPAINLDGDSGANDLQNFPVLYTAATTGSTLAVKGAIDSTANTTFRLEFFNNPLGSEDATGYGEGKIFLFAVDVTTDASGHADFDLAPQAATVAVGDRISATATVNLGSGVYGSTSEFSMNLPATSSNTAPVITVPGAQSVDEDAALTLSGISVADADGNLSGVQLTVGNGTLTVDLAGGASIAAGTNGSATLTLAGTQAQINTALGTLRYQGNANYSGGDTLTVIATDSNAASDTDTVALTVNPVNDAPVRTAGTVANLTVLEDSGFTSLGFGSVAYSPGGGADESGQTLTYSVTALPSGLGKVYLADGTTLVDTTSSYTLSDIRGMQFKPSTDATGISAFQYNVTDSGGTANGGSNGISEFVWITVTAVNDAPVVATTGTTLVYTENASATIIDPSLTLTDVDSANLSGASITISANYTVGQDALAFTNQLGITGSWDAGTGVLTLSGTTSKANYQTALRSITYVNSSDAPNTATRTIAFVVNDGALDSAAATRNVSITAVNDAPLLADTAPSITVTEDAANPSGAVGSLVSAFTGGISDADSGALKGIAIIASNETHGTWYYSTNGGTHWSTVSTVSAAQSLLLADDGNTRLYFKPAADYNGMLSSALTLRAWDRSSGSAGSKVDTSSNGTSTPYSSATDVIDATVTAVNDAPTFNSGKVTTAIGTGNDSGTSTLVQPDGKVLVAGYALVDSTYNFALLRYNTDGTLDTSFGSGGKVTTAIGASSDSGNSVAIQTDGKILVAGNTWNGNSNDFGLVRYNTDGSLDTSFGTGGKVTTAVGAGDDFASSVYVQTDGKIVVAGTTVISGNYDFALVRYNANGSLDASFGTGGKVSTAVGASFDFAMSVTVQSDGKVLVAGWTMAAGNNDVALVRYNANGSLDASFGTGGKVSTAIGSGTDIGQSVTVQPDGKILVAGYTSNGSNNDFALLRYNANGSLDTGFGTGGKVTTAIGSGEDVCNSLTLQSDGKILLVGHASNGSNNDVALVRYNADGSLDSGFGAGGKVITTIGASDDDGTSVIVLPDGRIVVTGTTWNGNDNDVALLRYHANGTLDTSFGAVNTLDGAPAYTENGAAVVLDANVAIFDAELSPTQFNGATLTLARNGGASSQDVFSASGTLAALTQGGNLTVGGTTIGTVTTNSGGTLLLTFNASASNALVNSAMQQIAYSNTSDSPPASVQINWTFSDGNTGAQGSGGALTATGSTTVAIIATNDAPSFGLGDGSLTTAPGSDHDIGRSVTVQSDGKILVAGYSYNGSNNDFALVRYNTDGSLDTSFSNDGMLTTAIGSGDDIGYSVTVQPNGKILVAGYSHNGSNMDFALVRYNADGSLDTSFSNDGMLTTAVGTGNDYAYSVVLQPDGKILVAGEGIVANRDFALVRYNADGSLDTSFSGDGMLTTAIGPSYDVGYSVALQPDGKILVAGFRLNGDQDFAVVRYNADGSLDTSFSGDGMLTTAIGPGYDTAYSLAIQPDGKILVGGQAYNGANMDFALARYNADGSLDTSFSNDGMLLTAIGSSTDIGYSVTIQPDGKILVAGESFNGSKHNFALVRYNSDGSLDTSFSGDGMLTTAVGAGNDYAYSVAVQLDGKILVTGSSNNGTNDDFALVRYNTDGSLDTRFALTSTLDNTPSLTENGAAIVLDNNVQIFDAELSVANDFNGATLTLARNGGADAQDVFSASGTLAALTQGGNLTVGGTTIGTVTTNSGGTLVLTFNASATNALVNSAMRQIAYSNSSDTPPASAQIDWTFSDGNSGAQGTGGALSATGSTAVTITATNDAPVLADTVLSINQTEDDAVPVGATGTLVSSLVGGISDADGGALKGIAVTAAVQTNGTWYYTTTGGSFWYALGTPDATSSRLLAADADTRLYFKPAANVNGTQSGVLTLRAWDRTTGSNGSTADTSSNGGSTAFSSASDTVDVNIASVNDAPAYGVGTGIVTTALSSGNDGATAVALQNDGKIVTVGYVGSGGGNNDSVVLRYNTNGSLDLSFSNDGRLITALSATDDYATAVAIQADGKILVAGCAQIGGHYDFTLTRYNTDGTLDLTFGGGNGFVTTNFGGADDKASAMRIQDDGKIVVVGTATIGGRTVFGLVRYNADGSLDNTFSGDGKQTTTFGTGDEKAYGVTLQTDGKIVVTGSSTTSGSDYVIAVSRYNTDGSLDTSFSGDGKLLAWVWGTREAGKDVAVQADGKIVVVSVGWVGAGNAMVVLRFNTNGTLDTSFNGSGTRIGTLSSTEDGGVSVAIQPDGKILVGDYSTNVSGKRTFAILRYNTDSTLDTSFSGTGGVKTTIGNGDSLPSRMALQPDGRIVLVGYTTDNSGYQDVAMVRYNSNGTLDTSFASSTLDEAPSYTESGGAVVLDSNVQIYDVELTAANNFNGATLTLARNGGANAQDVFSASGTLAALTQGGNLTVGGTTIGTVTTNSGGTLLLTFNASATNTLVNSAMQQIAYSNSSDTPPASAQIDWTFADGNSGAQGTGGALSASGSTTMTITATNDQPVFTSLDGAPTYTENGSAVVLDNNVTLSDAELTAANNFSGATLTLARNGGANSQDVFSASGTLAALTQGGNLTVGGTTIG